MSIELPATLTLTVTPEDWEAGERVSATSCAFALAANRVVPSGTRALVPGAHISLFYVGGHERLTRYRMPADAITLRQDFDKGEAPSLELPQTFELERVR
jgi:hypothetical protein